MNKPELNRENMGNVSSVPAFAGFAPRLRLPIYITSFGYRATQPAEKVFERSACSFERHSP
jgi:hypothetical protein